jgi:hypothetical protein
MGLVAALDDIPRPAWIVAMVIGFIWWWPVGLAVLAYLLGRRRLARCGPGRWYNMAQQGGDERPRERWERHWGRHWACGGRRQDPPPSGNAAFDEYRAETLRRLEEEQKEFLAYLERLRKARDKAEFDQFMADRRRMTDPGVGPVG